MSEEIKERPLTDLPDEFVTAYVPDGFGLDFESAASIALQMDKLAADQLEADALEVING